MDIFQCIYTRRSIRKYTQLPVEFDKLARIIDAGVQAPSAGNIQNWRFILVLEKSLIKQVYEHCLRQEVVYNAQAIIIICGDVAKGERMYGLRGKRLYTTQNCACAVENMLLAAHALDLGACWIGAFDESKIASLFNIPDDIRPQSIISIGHPDEHPESHRKELTSFVYFNEYGNKVKDLHLHIRDYSIEIEKRMKQIEEDGKLVGDTISKRIKRFLKKLKDYMKDK